MQRRLKQNVAFSLPNSHKDLSSVSRIPLHPSVECLERIVKCTTDERLTKRLYAFMHQVGLDTHLTLGNSLIPLLSEAGNTCSACDVMEKMQLPDDRCWNSLMTALVRHGEFQRALNLYHDLPAPTPHSNSYAFAALLRACAQLKDATTGIQLHAEISATSLLENDIFVGNALIYMYTACGLLAKAQEVFDKLPFTDVVSWTSMIAGYTKHEDGDEALECFNQMQLAGVSPNAVTYVCSLKACGIVGALDKGYEIHFEISRKGMFDTNIFVGSALVDMYAKCGALTRAQEVFDKLSTRDLVAWNALIAGYADHEEGNEALDRYEQMLLDGFSPDSATFVSTLKACGGSGAIDKGQEIHINIARRGMLEREIDVVNALIDMYAKCGSLAKAQEVFDKLPFRNKVSWNSLIAGYAKHEEYEEALSCVKHMQFEGFSPDSVTLVCLLNACGNIVDIQKGQEIHAELVRRDTVNNNCAIGSALIDMYVKCGYLVKAQEVFDKFLVRNVIQWTALIAGYVQHDFAKEALDCLEDMILDGVPPNNVTYACCLKACSMVGATLKGGQLHAETARNGLLEFDTTIQSTLVDMYARVGQLEKAQEVVKKLPTPDVFCWNALIAGYAHLGDCTNVLWTFEKLKLDGLQPDLATFCNILSACNIIGMVDMGHWCLDTMNRDHSIGPTIEHHTCMIELYSRTGHPDKAVALAKRLPCDPDQMVWHVVLDACQRAGNLELGKSTFEHSV